VATLSQLASRLRSEIGDTPRSFVDTYTGDGLTTRFQLSQAPVLGSSLVITVAVPTSTSTVTSASAASGTVTYTSSNTLTAGQTVNITGLTNSISITAIAGSGSVVTYSTTSTTGLSAGQTITISGSTTTGFNGTKTILAVNAGISFTVTSTVTGATSTATGTYSSPFNLTGVTVASRTTTSFTVTNATTGVAVTGASAVASGLSATFNVSSTTVIEEGIGILTLAVAPTNNAVITISGTAYRYFTDSEIYYYINNAFLEHSRNESDTNGSSLTTLNRLPGIEEYPVILLASTMALYTLANDSAFDIDIISPDGVSIPRSERYRQLTEMVQTRKEQYRELCVMLGVGLYRIEVMTLRRISRMSNRYIPVYRPQEIDDASLPQRVSLSLPNYGDISPSAPVISKDLSLYSGDDFIEVIRFSMDLTSYTPLAQIRLSPSIPASRVGPVILGTFTITKSASTVGGIVDTLTMTLPGSVTANLPNVAYYDLQLTSNSNKVKTYLYGKVFTHSEVSNPIGPF
jgi:hypothetical protein